MAEWVFATLDRLLSENHIEFIKWDMNRPFSEPGWPGRRPATPERVWTDHVHNLYAVIDALRAVHPGVEFESCAGGGGRVDLGILRRVEQVWTSDNTDAWDRVKIQEGFTQAYPPQAMMAWVTDSPNLLTRRELPLSFRFHVAMAGALGVGGDLLRWTDAELAEAAELIAAYKDIRPVVQRGRLYRLASVLDGPFGASEYVAGDDVVVLGWWGPRQCGARPGPDPAGRPGRRRPLPGHRLGTAALGRGADGGGPRAAGGDGEHFRQHAGTPRPRLAEASHRLSATQYWPSGT